MMTKTIQLSPSYLNPHLERYLDEQLSEEVEGKCLGQEGYIIAVIETVDRGRARVIEGLGGAEFKMKYRAIVYRPFRGEVVDGIVASVNKVLQALLSAPNTELTSSCRWASSSRSALFHASSRLMCAISSPPAPLEADLCLQLIPPDYSFDPNANPPCFSSSEDPVRGLRTLFRAQQLIMALPRAVADREGRQRPPQDCRHTH